MGTQVEGRPPYNPPQTPASAIPAAVRQRLRTQINVTPSPKAVVNSGDFSYFSDKGMNPLPYALSEFVDNSLAAINLRMASDSGASLAPNIIPGDIRISFDRSDKHTALIIWDNGCGMNIEALQHFAIFALSPEDRLAKLNAIKKPTPQTCLSEFYSNPLRINTNISMFGVGAKMSAFFIGQELTMVTKCRDSADVLEYRCNSSELISEYKDTGINCYNKSINHRAPGAIADSELAKEASVFKRLKGYLEIEKQHQSFTYAVISGVKKDFVARFESSSNETAFSLAEVYHWYLHGHPNLKTAIGGNVTMSLSVNSLPTLDIKTIPSVPKEQLARQKDTFSFEIVDRENNVAVFGFVNYFPFDDVETCPNESKVLSEWLNSAQPESDDEDDQDGCSSESDASQQNVPAIFSCWWQGRLIPMTKVDHLKWMSSSFKLTTSRCRYRVKGCLFFDRSFKVTQNKSTFTEDLRFILERTSVEVHLVDKNGARGPRSTKSIEDSFKEWIKSCHSKYDKEVQLRNRLKKEDHSRWRSWLEYGEMVISGKESKTQSSFKTGDVVRVISQSPKLPKFGRIVKFLRANPSSADDFDSHADAAFVSGSDRGLKCQVQPLPEFCYPTPQEESPPVFIKLRMIDKTTSKEEVQRQLDIFTKDQMKFIPHRLGLYIYEPGIIPSKVPAGYKFPNVDIQIHSFSSEPLTNIPFSKVKLKARQRFYRKIKGKEELLKSFDGHAKEKVFSFWEIDTIFKECGSYSCVFDVPNYKSPLDDAKLTKTYELQVVPGPPASLTFSKNAANPLTITMGAPSKGSISAQFSDQFKNACIPDEVFLNNIVLSHEHLCVKHQPFKTINGQVVIASLYIEPKSTEGGKFVRFNPNEITSLDVGVKGGRGSIGTIPVSLMLGEPYSMAWATDDTRPLRVTSGGSLPSFKIQLLDRYGLPARPNSTVKSLTISLLDSSSKINGVTGKTLKPPISNFDDSGLIAIPEFQINSGLNKVTLRASLLINKPRLAGHPIMLDREIIVQPGNMLGRVTINIANENDENPTVVVGTKHSLQVDLFGENGQAWPKPYSEAICKRHQLQYNGESFPLTPLGIIPNVVTFPQRIQNGNLFKISASVMEISEDTVNVPFSCQTQVTLIPDEGEEWQVKVMRPIRCAEPIGDAIQFRYLDRFRNECKIDPSTETKVSFGGQCSLQGSMVATFDPSGTCMTYPGIILIGHGPGYSVIVNGKTLTKFEIIEGPPCSLILNVSGDLRSFPQIVSENMVQIDVPILSRSKRDFHVHALDASGSIVSYPPNITVVCRNASVTSISAPHPYKKSFQLSFNVPVRQTTVTVAITCDRISRPMVCVFPVEPWGEGVSAVSLDPMPSTIVAGASFPVTGHILDDAGNSILLHQNANLLSSLALVFANTDTKRDLAKELFAPAAFRDTDGAFAFIARDAITMAGTYNVSVIYTEKRLEVLDLLDPDHRSLHSKTLTLKISPGPGKRLYVDVPISEEPSVSVRPIPKLLKISVQDDFCNPVGHRFSQRDAEKIELMIVRHPIEHLAQPTLSIDSTGSIVVQSLGTNPDRPLPQEGTYTLRFRVPTYPNLQACSLDFFYSVNVQAITEFKELTVQEEGISNALSSLRTELRNVSESLMAITDRINICRDSCRAIFSRHFRNGQDVDVAKVLEESKSEYHTVRAEIARTTKTALVGAGNHHQRLQSMPEFIGFIGLLGTCSNDDDCRLVSYALYNKITAPIFHTISAADSRKLNMKHFALDCMSNRSGVPSLARHRQLFTQYGRQWSSDPVTLFELFHPDPNISQELFTEIFSALVGGWIVCQTYDDGLAFKRFCVRHNLPCFSIITYDGRLIMNSGELGGSVPPLSKMNLRVGVEPRHSREQLISCEKRIKDLEQHERLVAEERQLCQQQNDSSDEISNIEQKIQIKEKELEEIRKKIETVDRNSSTTRKRRRSSAGGPSRRRRID